jgi:hypothetical protein
MLEVWDERLSRVADGAISSDVEYQVAPARRGSDVRACVGVRGHGLVGRLLAEATEALLGAGALQSALNRLADQSELATAV